MGRLESFKQRGRNRQNRKRRPIIVIGCEGNNKTEEIGVKIDFGHESVEMI